MRGRFSRALLADLARWEEGSIGVDDLAARHPEHASELTEMHALVAMLTAETEDARGPSWKVLSAMLPSQCAPEEERGLSRSLAVKSVIAAFLAGAVVAPATAAAQRGENVTDGGAGQRRVREVVLADGEPAGSGPAGSSVLLEDAAVTTPVSEDTPQDAEAPGGDTGGKDSDGADAGDDGDSPTASPGGSTPAATTPTTAPADTSTPTSDPPGAPNDEEEGEGEEEPGEEPESSPAPEPNPAPDSGSGSGPETAGGSGDEGHGRSADAPGHGGDPPGQANRPDKSGSSEKDAKPDRGRGRS